MRGDRKGALNLAKACPSCTGALIGQKDGKNTVL